MRAQFVKNVRILCNVGRHAPWNPWKGSGRDRFEAFLKRHPTLALRSSRIYEANRVLTADYS
ncbi:unnamed protein product [Ascophyllum nodosum]